MQRHRWEDVVETEAALVRNEMNYLFRDVEVSIFPTDIITFACIRKGRPLICSCVLRWHRLFQPKSLVPYLSLLFVFNPIPIQGRYFEVATSA